MMSITAARPETASRITLIRPDSRLKDGWGRSLSHLANELYAFRSHIAAVYERDLRQTYRGSAIAIFWQYALPLVPVAVYAGLASLRLVRAFDDVPPAAYVAVGVMLWFLMSDCVRQPIQVLRTRNQEAMKTALPLSASIAASFVRMVFDAAVRAAFCVVIIVVSGASVSWLAPLFLGVVALALLACLGAGLLLAIFNIIYPDVDRVVAVVLQYGIFLSGVIIPLPASGPLSLLALLNPFAVFIDSARGMLFHGALPHPMAFSMFAALGIAVFVFGCRQFYIMEYRIRGIG